jgi:hypothetical protein
MPRRDEGRRSESLRYLGHESSGAAADSVTLSLQAGAAADVAVFAPATLGATPGPIALPHPFPSALFDSDGKLDVEIFVRGLRHPAGDVVLRATLHRNAADLVRDDVKLRIGDQPPLAGERYAAGFPHWYTRRAINAGSPVQIAIDPSLQDERRGLAGFQIIHAGNDETRTVGIGGCSGSASESFRWAAGAST